MNNKKGLNSFLIVTFCTLSTATFAQFFGAAPSAEELSAAKAVETPRTADGHPDLSGYWSRPPTFGTVEMSTSEDGQYREFDVPSPSTLVARQAAGNNSGFAGFGGARGGGPGGPGGNNASAPFTNDAPSVKEEFRADVQYLYDNRDSGADPNFTCAPTGIPRSGPPNEIFQSKDAVALLYSSHNIYRIIPTHDGASYDPYKDPTWWGDSIGHWEDDTLVVESVNITEESWLANNGFRHSDALRVTERFSREGNALTYNVTAFDDKVLTEPWVKKTEAVVLGPAGNHIQEDYLCLDKDSENMVLTDHVLP